MRINELSQIKGTILLEGETGVGKSYWAKKIHALSELAQKSFIEVNLATLSEELIESELFGHVKGAFSGAIQERQGYFEKVNGGILFLDEIGELSLSAQKKLLAILENKTFTRIGSCIQQKFSGRIIAATNLNLEEQVKKGLFRADLFFRLRVFSFHLAPLRETSEKIIPMGEAFFYSFAARPLCISEEVENFLKHYAWPGNIRELKNLMEYLASLTTGLVKISDLPTWVRKNFSSDPSPEKICPETYGDNYKNSLEAFEKSYLEYYLKHFSGKINFTARQLGMNKVTLIAKVKKYGINTELIKLQTQLASYKDNEVLGYTRTA